ncbi:hypothetical protein [Actinomadura napierensis]|uniref:VWA domain-containing protein n=1 Tax=Actinomadura napierensis TaxID=267854 RepID=A0ABP5LW49_9ACTN
MTEPPGGERSRPPERRIAGIRADHLLQAIFIELCSGVIVGVLAKLVHDVSWTSTLIVPGAVVLATVGLVVLFPAAARRALEWLAKKWNGAAVAWTLAGGAVMALVVGATAGVNDLREQVGGCGQPLELRVLAPPEALTPLRAAANEFADEGESRGCRRYGITVVPDSGPVPLYDAFRRLWRRSGQADEPHADDEQLFGPQPDIWIPSSTAEFDYVPKTPGQVGGTKGTALGAGGGGGGAAERPAEGDPYFVPRGSLGTSPLVLALFTRAHESVADPTAAPISPSTAALLRRFADAGVDLHAIARPVPETSAAALAVTPALYGSTQGDDNSGDERFAEPANLVAPDGVSLLCRFRQEAAAGNAGPPDDIAVAVPEQVLYDYDMGRPLGDRCGGVDADDPSYAKWVLHPYYATDLPTLNYPFVQVRWRGQDTEARNTAVTEFHDWLVRHPLTMQGFRDGSGYVPSAREGDTRHYYLSRLQSAAGGDLIPNEVSLDPPKGVRETLTAIGAARPRVSVSLMLDVSGSMGGAARSGGGSRLAQGTSFLQSLVSQLQTNDRAGLQVSSATASPTGAGTFGNVPRDAASPDQKNLITGRLQAVASGGGDQALSDAIAAADTGSGKEDLVLVTDGQVPRTNPHLASRASWLAGDFRRRHPDLRLTVVLTGPVGCDASPVSEIVAALGAKGKGCVPLTDAPVDEQAAQLLSELR